MSNNGILEEITVINSLDRNDGCFFIRTEEFIRCFPDRRNSVFKPRSREYLIAVVSKEDFGKGIKIAGERLGLIKVLGLVKDKTNYANTWVEKDK